MVEGVDDRGRAVPEPQLGEHVVDVGLDRALAKAQSGGDLTVRLALSDEREDLALAAAERVKAGLAGRRGRRGRPVNLEHPSGHRRVKPGTAFGDDADGPLQVLGRHALQDEAGRPGAQHACQHFVVVERGQRHHRGRGLMGPQSPRCFHPVEAWHPDIHEHHVGVEQADGLDHLGPV